MVISYCSIKCVILFSLGHQDPIQHPEKEQTDKELIIKTESNVSENTAAVKIPESNVLATLDSASNLFGDSPIINTSLDLRYPENRLAVFGGPLAILEDMKKNGVSPNVLTFTQLLDSLPQKNEAELQLLEYMKAENVPRDIDLYNMMIRRRNRRNDYQGATVSFFLLRLCFSFLFFSFANAFGIIKKKISSIYCASENVIV